VKPTSLVIHHTASPAGNADTIRQQHLSRGWSDIAYHAVICNGKGGGDGVVQAGRPETRQGAGVYGNNKDRLQVALVGNFEKGHPGFTGSPTSKQFRALGEWLLSRGGKHRIPAAKVVGHREIALTGHGTLCPGTEMPLADIRRWYGAGGPVPLDEFLGRAPEPEHAFKLFIDGIQCTEAAGATLEDGVTRIHCAAKDLCAAMGWGITYDPEINWTRITTDGSD
jgi:hypothetical protein